MASAKRLENDLTQGSVAKKLLRYSLPLVCTSLLQAVYSLADIWVAGRFIGDGSIAAINNASLIMSLLTQIIIGLTVGGNVLIGQYYGAGDAENRKKATGTLFTICMIGGVGCSVIFFLLARPLLTMLQAPTLDDATAYLSVCAWGLIFIFGYNALSAILRALGNSKIPLYCIIASTVINVGLDLLLVAVLGWGVVGAAVATVTAQAIAFLVALIYMVRHRATIGFYSRYLKPSLEKVGQIIKLGIPLALQWTAASISWLVVLFLINQYGAGVADANGISIKIKDFCQLFILSLTSGGSTMVAQNLGAGEVERAKQVMKTCLKVMLAIAAVLIVIIEITAPWLVGLFTENPEVQYWAVLNLRIEIIAQIFYAAFMSFHTIATGAGRTLFVMINSAINCILARVILAFVFEQLWGVTGVYIACAVAPAVSVPIGYFYYRSGRWQRNLIGRAGG